MTYQNKDQLTTTAQDVDEQIENLRNLIRADEERINVVLEWLNQTNQDETWKDFSMRFGSEIKGEQRWKPYSIYSTKIKGRKDELQYDDKQPAIVAHYYAMTKAMNIEREEKHGPAIKAVEGTDEFPSITMGGAQYAMKRD